MDTSIDIEKTTSRDITYMPRGVCSQKICFTITENETIKNIVFTGGCNGNLKGIASLAEGQSIQEVIKKLKGIHCGLKNTSCPDQLVQALEQHMHNK